MLQNLTFTGIDNSTELDGLLALSKDYPNIEFGVLTCSDWHDKGMRYPDPILMNHLGHKELQFALHICGRDTKDVLNGNWDNIIARFGDSFQFFQRIQLNLGRQKVKLRYSLTNVPDNVKEIIVQQSDIKALDMYKYLKGTSLANTFRVTTLVDGSGGRGVSCSPSEDLFACMDGKFGFAGGINPRNCRDIYESCEQFSEILKLPYWLDMESGVRTDDNYFSINACRKVCEEVFEHERRTL